ncbi:sirohydrochlorin chelatase [Paraliobacillus zengyii]|uniref:sirohydrochlorin chelatase n=1 Tax=Paraliobacillus zengyii TaxID=2213194 RepID=UPI000DD4BF4B|nr:sirohydrochlorin chelatase [Paraliobacillus zengyii]
MINIQAVLYVCHGSRVKKAAQEAINFIEKTMKLVDTEIQEYCFLELASPSIIEGVDQCIKQGATKIAVVPVLLLTAGHAKKDIPEELEHAQNKYQDVQFSYGKPIGVQEKMNDVLVERLEERTVLTPQTNILLVGRGSSDQDAVNDIQSIADSLQGRVHVSSVEKCFLAAATPKFKDKLKATVSTGAEHIVILPYLLFTGILMKEIREFVDELSLNPEQEVIICDYLGDHDHVCEQLKNRVVEAIRNEEPIPTLI